ncbi:MAG: amidohydrolase [Gemmatimonadetes bacterium]|nr:amidohydrolase [Gemmatimonadota bacterium]
MSEGAAADTVTGRATAVSGALAQFTAEERAQVLALRRALHVAPELSWQEHGTQRTLRAALEAAGITAIREVAGTGLVATIPGTDPTAPIIALRGDIDALPIAEETGLPFASTHPGVMHACGHDLHAAWTVAAGILLAKAPAPGTVHLVLQPAEEVGEGAARMLASGALDGVRAIFGGHVDWRFPVGEVVATDGAIAASTDTFEVVFHGRGGHGARPQDARDPIVALAAFVMEVQTLVSRRLDPGLPGVVSVTIAEAGSAANVIPERARVAGTIRATTPAARTLLCDGVRAVAESVAALHGVRAECTLSEGTPPLLNAPVAAACARAAVREVMGESALTALPTANMGGEDFAFYTERMPGCFLRIGTLGEGRSAAGVHTPRFDPDETALFIGGAVLAACARVASAPGSVFTTGTVR